jgi:hypothetical protein
MSFKRKLPIYHDAIIWITMLMISAVYIDEENFMYESVSKSFRTQSMTKNTLITISIHWEAT